MSGSSDDSSGLFFVVTNEEGQHALWPELAGVPAGWAVVHGPADRAACLEYVVAHWTDTRPLSLARSLSTGNFGR